MSIVFLRSAVGLLWLLTSAVLAQPVPDFVHGDECLFCHRNDIGPGWQKNAHGLTVRQNEDAPELVKLTASQPFAAAAEFFLGSRNHVRVLKKDGYNKFTMLPARLDLKPEPKWVNASDAAWDKTKFGDRCAGCHTTGVDPETKAFAAFGLDCYACHGNVNLEHTNDTSLIFLSKKRRSDTKAITSTCAQCHLRGGKSKSTGLPYPKVFLVGDDLFRDYEADFAKAQDASLNPGDRHVYRNVRDVVENGSSVTCLDCHRIHQNSSSKHRLVLTSPACLDCHNAEGPKKLIKPYTVVSEVCEY